MMQHKAGVSHVGWIDKLKTDFKIDTLINYIHSSKNQIIEAGIYGGIGFLCGFLCKRYAQYVFWGVICIAFIALLAQLGIVEVKIQWDVLYRLIGLQLKSNHADTMTTCFEWIKIHVWLVLSFFIGFFGGMKIT